MNLSIIIPVYNCEKYIQICLGNIIKLEQEEITFEVIFVNDGSTDNSLYILKEIERKYDFVRVISQNNSGSGGARNTGLDIVKGKYIQFIDVDDKIDILDILKMFRIADKEDIEVLGYRLDYLDETYRLISERPKHNIPYSIVYTGLDALDYGYQPSSLCVFLFKRQFLNNYNLRIKPKIAHMDVEFMLRVMLKAQRVKFLDCVSYHYVQRRGSITKPTTQTGLEKLVYDEVSIALMMKDNINESSSFREKNIIIKNYNSVIWNLLWRFISKPRELSTSTKVKCLSRLKHNDVFPVSCCLKTRFQMITRYFLNLYFYIYFMVNK